MRIKFLIFLLFILILGCIELKKTPDINETKTATPQPSSIIAEQKLPTLNETRINITFETWSRGYWSNSSYYQTYFRIITNYSAWIAFLDEQRYPGGLEGELSGYNRLQHKIEPGDFSNYFIIAAMMGHRSKQEPEIEIKTISRDDVVNVTVRMYESNIGALVESAPYHIVIVKREVLPRGNSTFNFIDTEGERLGKLEIKK